MCNLQLCELSAWQSAGQPSVELFVHIDRNDSVTSSFLPSSAVKNSFYVPLCLYFLQFLQCLILNCVKSRHGRFLLVLSYSFEPLVYNDRTFMKSAPFFGFFLFFWQKEIMLCMLFLRWLTIPLCLRVNSP